jgi:hypothetical protein
MIEFSFLNYQNLISDNIYNLPNNFFPFIQIDRRKYNELEIRHTKNGIPIGISFDELRKRISKNYFQKVYPAQSSVLYFSERAFPSYRFHLPELLAHDWLATVDWHKEYCRDHTLHQPLTAYIVYQLLGGGDFNKSLKIGKSNLLELCIRNILKWEKTEYLKEYLLNLGIKEKDYLFTGGTKIALWKGMFFETAFVSAIFHDLGYPWQYINRLNNSLSTSDFSLNNSLDNAKHILNNFKNRLILYPFNGYSSIKNDTPCNWGNKLLDLISFSYGNTHGFPGAIGFLYLYDSIRKYPSEANPIYQFCIDWAAMSIMMHDFERIYLGKDEDSPPENKYMRLEFDRDPLSCIVALADFLEDFERPEVEFKNINGRSCSISYNDSFNSANIEFINGDLNITYKFNDWKKNAIKFEFKKKEAKRYFDPDNGFINLSSLNVKKVNLLHI